jgi:hypothetical protein
MRREYHIATKAYISLYDIYIEIEAELSLVFALVVPGLAYIRLPFVPSADVRSGAPAHKGEVRNDRLVPSRPFLRHPESRIALFSLLQIGPRSVLADPAGRW